MNWSGCANLLRDPRIDPGSKCKYYFRLKNIYFLLQIVPNATPDALCIKMCKPQELVPVFGV